MYLSFSGTATPSWELRSRKQNLSQSKEAKNCSYSQEASQAIDSHVPYKTKYWNAAWQSPQTSYVFVAFVFHRQTSVNGHILLMKRRRLRVHLGVKRREFPRQYKFLDVFRKTMFSSIKIPRPYLEPPKDDLPLPVTGIRLYCWKQESGTQCVHSVFI